MVSFAERSLIREGLSEVLPVLWSFLTLNTDRLISLSEDRKQASVWDGPLAIMIIYISVVIGFLLFIDGNSIPSYHVAVFSIVINIVLSATLILGPLAIAFRQSVGRFHIPLLLNMQLAGQLLLILGICLASLWAIFPQHVRTDLYVFGHGRGEGTAIHGAVCGDLELGVRWYRLAAGSQRRLESNYQRLVGNMTGNPASPEEQQRMMASEIGWARANLRESVTLLESGEAATARFLSTYPSLVQAFWGWIAFAAIMILMFYINIFRAVLSLARSMQEMGKGVRRVSAAIACSLAGIVALILLQQRDLPDFDIEPGPQMMARLEREIRKSRAMLFEQRSAIIEGFERFKRYCPDVSDRGLS